VEGQIKEVEGKQEKKKAEVIMRALYHVLNSLLVQLIQVQNALQQQSQKNSAPATATTPVPSVAV